MLPTRWEISGLETGKVNVGNLCTIIFPLAGKSVDWKQLYGPPSRAVTSSHSLGNQWIGNRAGYWGFPIVMPASHSLGNQWIGNRGVAALRLSGCGFPLAGKSVDWKRL